MPNSLRSRRHRALVSVIVDARKAAGLTQRDLAAKLRVPQSLIAMIESYQRRVDVIEFLDLCRALKVPPHELLDQLLKR